MPPDIAFAASAREWPDRLHRFVLDHGGARVVGRVLSADQVSSTTADALLIDDVCSFLTPQIVRQLKSSGVEVVGVFEPGDRSDAKRRLLECGISDVIEADASPEEFLQKVEGTLSHREVVADEPEPIGTVYSVGVSGATAGVGITEVSVGLALCLADRVNTCLVDLDQNWPSVAQRLGLPVHPNIRTALDEVLHTRGRAQTPVLAAGELSVIGGRSDRRQGAPIHRAEVLALLMWLRDGYDIAVADLGPISEIPQGLIREFNSLVVVGTGDPVGLVRLSEVVGSLDRERQSVVAVVNGVRPHSYQRSEIVGELARTHPWLQVVTLPHDRSVTAAAWDGSPSAGKRMVGSLRAMADLIAATIS